MYYLGIDIGGTNVVVGIIDESYNILASDSFKTLAPRSAESICDDIAKTAQKLAKKCNIDYNEIKAAGAASPGIISNGVCEFANNLGFKNVPLAQMLSEKLGIKTYLLNDANAAAFGEFAAGCGKGKSSLVMLTIGTGIGGGIVIDQNLFEGADGLGAEMGHFIVKADGRKCSCGTKGCLEAYCSATALIKDTKTAMEKNPDSLMWSICPDIEKVNGTTVFRAAEKGDKSAKRVLKQFIKYLSVGVYNIIVLFQPEVICIGGGMSREEENLLKPIRNFIKKNNLASLIGRNTEIRPALLFGDAGLIGAAAFAKKESK